MLDAGVPVEVGTAAAEGRHEPGELGVHGAAVVALVVVLGQDLVVGGDLVAEAAPDDERLQRVARERRDQLGDLARQVGCRLPG